jgi:peroxiredoxin
MNSSRFITQQEKIMEPIQSLAEQLSNFKTAFKRRVAPERVNTMEHATAALRATGIEALAKNTGDSAPDITLPDALGKPTQLAELWKKGPLVVIFYRGGWCPYCNLELRAWQRRLPELENLGASLVAISPQTPDNSLSTAEKNELAFPVLSDSSLEAANSFGIAFKLPPELIELYQSVGNNLPELNGNSNGNSEWVLPVPATFVIDQNGTIQFAHVEVDYRERAEPADVLAAIEKLGVTLVSA